ncbi:MAG: 2-oxo acid dehydrogenase subunit E2 [Treponema sp.]|jgi:pyruvate dehydrogenase E2 component (dihydrolipoamide acetyltransferase)|nr:2-oxo acid dehydrogenase subunit E2 [Treponema sp.]
MAHVLIMPRQGNTVESCIIGEWKVKEGDSVSAGTVICVIETDKAVFEVPAGADGAVLKILHGAGDDVPVLEPIAVIGGAGEKWEEALSESPPGTAADAPAGLPPDTRPPAPLPPDTRPPADAALYAASGGAAPQGAAADGAGAQKADAGAPPVSPRARNLALREGLPLGGVAGTGPAGRVIERDVTAALKIRPPLTAAARAAVLSGSPLPQEGTGMGGRITIGDLAPARQGAADVSGGSFQDEGAVTETPIRGIRKVIAGRMFQSLAESAQLTLNTNAPAARLQELRARFKVSEEKGFGGLSKITINDLVLFAVARTLPRFPFMNARKNGDTLKTFERVHLGMAVDTPRGLMVPVIRNASLLTLAKIAEEAGRLAAACQNGTVKPEELGGSTFTVTNLGSLGITSFTPILNAPEVAILGVCGIELKPVPGGDGAVFEPRMGLSLTINHEVVDGAPAARFLMGLCGAIGNIDLLLAGG